MLRINASIFFSAFGLACLPIGDAHRGIESENTGRALCLLPVPQLVGVVLPCGVFEARAPHRLDEDERLFVWMALEDGLDQRGERVFMRGKGEGDLLAGQHVELAVPFF